MQLLELRVKLNQVNEKMPKKDTIVTIVKINRIYRCNVCLYGRWMESASCGFCHWNKLLYNKYVC